MKTIKEKYTGVLNEEISKAQFLRDVRLELPSLITQYNGYEDAVKILKNKGILEDVVVSKELITEEKHDTYQQPEVERQEEDVYFISSLERAIDSELEKAGTDTSTNTVQVDVYTKAKNKALKNLKKDSLYYYKKLSGQKPVKKDSDKMKPFKASELVDKLNGMQKVKLKESIKKVIHRILNEESN